MGFFDEMLAGGLAGAGKGMVDYANTREREDDKRAQLEAQTQLKREMLADQLASKKELAEMRFGAGGGAPGASSGGSRSSGGGGFFDSMLQSAKTPEDVDKAIRYAQLRMGPDAAAATAEYFGRPLQETVDVNASHAIPDSQQGPRIEPEMVTRNKSYDKDKGAEALNRLIAQADPGKYDDYTKGETTTVKLDAARAAAKGLAPMEAAETIQSLTGDGDQRKIDSAEKMNTARIKARAASGGSGGPKLRSTKVDANGQVIGYMSDGSTKVMSDTSLDFNKTVSNVIETKSKNDFKFAKLSPDEKRAQVIAQLGAKPTAPAAGATKKPTVSNW